MMKNAATIIQILIRLVWLILLVLGILVWAGHNQPWVPAHEWLGVAFIILLWALVYLGVRRGAAPGLVAIVFLWSLVVLAVGLTQTGILTGSSHWIIQVLHALVGLVAIGLAEALGARIKGRLARPA